MNIPIDLLGGPIASYLDRESMNSLQLASKDIRDILQRSATFPWPEAVRFFNQAYAKKIMFSPNGKWLVYADTNGVVTVWDQCKGKLAEEHSSLDWISLMAISGSSTWVACANTIDDNIVLYHLPTSMWHVPIKCQKSMNYLVFVHDILCVGTNTGILILDLNNIEGTIGDEIWDCDGTPSVFRSLHQGQFNHITPVHWVEPILTAVDNNHHVHMWVLDKVGGGHRIICQNDAMDVTGRYVVAMSPVGDGSPNGFLAVAGWCYGKKKSFIDIWSCTESSVTKRIPIDHRIRVNSFVMISETSYVIADGTIDQVRIWRNNKHYARCLANPTRMDFTVYKNYIAWIGRGSILWLRDLDSLVD